MVGGVDATSGAQYNLSPTSVTVRLSPNDSSSNSNEESEEAATSFIKELNELDILKDTDKISEDEYNAMRTSLFKKYYPDLDQSVLENPD